MMLASVLAGLGLGVSVVMLVGLLTGRWQPVTPTWRTARPVVWARRVFRGPYRGDAARRNHQRRMVTAAIAAGAVWLVTGLPVFAVIVAVAIPGLPWLLGGGRLEEDAIDRMEAIQAWTRRLNDLVATGTGLQQAIVSSVDTVPGDIAGEVRQLAARLRAGQAPVAALTQFADDLADEHADEVIAALVQHMSTRGARLSDVLVGIADSAAEQIANRRAVHAERANGRLTLTVLTSLAVAVLGVGPFMGEYALPYTTGIGQVILLAAVGALVVLLLLARRINMPHAPTRFLAAAHRDEAAPAPQAGWV